MYSMTLDSGQNVRVIELSDDEDTIITELLKEVKDGTFGHIPFIYESDENLYNARTPADAIDTELLSFGNKLLVQDVFSCCNSAAAYYAKNNRFCADIFTDLSNYGHYLTVSDMFSNPLTKAASCALLYLPNISNVEKIEESIESIMLELYKFAKEQNICITFDKNGGLTKQTLESMLACDI